MEPVQLHPRIGVGTRLLQVYHRACQFTRYISLTLSTKTSSSEKVSHVLGHFCYILGLSSLYVFVDFDRHSRRIPRHQLNGPTLPDLSLVSPFMGMSFSWTAHTSPSYKVKCLPHLLPHGAPTCDPSVEGDL